VGADHQEERVSAAVESSAGGSYEAPIDDRCGQALLAARCVNATQGVQNPCHCARLGSRGMQSETRTTRPVGETTC
jgi:hypothetical protein